MKPTLGIVTTSFPDGQDGQAAAGIFVRDLALSLARLIPVYIVAPGSSYQGHQRIAEGVNVYRYHAPRQPLSLLNPISPQDWPAIVATFRSGQRAVLQLAERGVTHIFALWTLPCGYWALRASRRYGVPYSCWALGSDIWSLGRYWPLRKLLRRVIVHATKVFADGYGLCQDVENITGRNCDFLPSSRQLPKLNKPFHQPSKGPPYRLAFLGRWHPNKGVDLLMQALEMLGDEEWKRIEEMRIAGGGPLEGVVRDAATRLTRKRRPISLLGYLNPTQAAELLTWADYLIIPSRIESIPVVFSDAMQTGTPVIATPVGDLPRLVRNLNVGIIAEAVDTASIARAISNATRDSALHPGLTAANNMFSIDTTASQLVQLLELGDAGL